MKTFNRKYILILMINLMYSISHAQIPQKFSIEIESIDQADSEYQQFIKQLIMDCFLSNGNFKLNASRQQFNKVDSKSTAGSKLELTIKVHKANMEKIKAASYSFYSKETTFTQCYNFVVSVELIMSELNSGFDVYSKTFDIDHIGDFEPGILAVSEQKAIRRSGNLLMASILSWLNSDMASYELISDKIILINKMKQTNSNVAFR